MATQDEDRVENTANRRGSGGPLESKAITIPEAGADNAPQQTEDEHLPEASDQTTADS
jgi:hypothetical protein